MLWDVFFSKNLIITFFWLKFYSEVTADSAWATKSSTSTGRACAASPWTKPGTSSARTGRRSSISFSLEIRKFRKKTHPWSVPAFQLRYSPESVQLRSREDGDENCRSSKGPGLLRFTLHRRRSFDPDPVQQIVLIAQTRIYPEPVDPATTGTDIDPTETDPCAAEVSMTFNFAMRMTIHMEDNSSNNNNRCNNCEQSSRLENTVSGSNIIITISINLRKVSIRQVVSTHPTQWLQVHFLVLSVSQI